MIWRSEKSNMRVRITQMTEALLSELHSTPAPQHTTNVAHRHEAEVDKQRGRQGSLQLGGAPAAAQDGILSTPCCTAL